ncbi:hypothetical protein MA16_Dca029242 [Dendrobium catenatum]|nr:hypothetical protein MA16_Dca029242 [Dendrobium catenatum]
MDPMGSGFEREILGRGGRKTVRWSSGFVTEGIRLLELVGLVGEGRQGREEEIGSWGELRQWRRCRGRSIRAKASSASI